MSQIWHDPSRQLMAVLDSPAKSAAQAAEALVPRHLSVTFGSWVWMCSAPWTVELVARANACSASDRGLSFNSMLKTPALRLTSVIGREPEARMSGASPCACSATSRVTTGTTSVRVLVGVTGEGGMPCVARCLLSVSTAKASATPHASARTTGNDRRSNGFHGRFDFQIGGGSVSCFAP
jgi:hypothetical protein